MNTKNTIIGICFVLFTSFILIFSLEILSRYIYPEWGPQKFDNSDLYQHDELLGWKHQPNQTSRFETIDFSVDVVTNSRGLRDKEYGLEKPPGIKRILILGDSFGWGFGVEHGDRIDEIIESKYDDIEIINASIAGYGTDQQYLYLKNRGILYNPDLVVVMFYPNDVNNNSSKIQYQYEKPFFILEENSIKLTNVPVPELGFWSKANIYIMNRTYFIKKVISSFKYFVLNPLGLSNPQKSSYEEALDITKSLLLKVDGYTSSNKIDLIVVFLPGPLKREPLNKVLDELKDFAEYSEINHLSLKETFEDKQKEAYFENNLHWNEYGHEIAAKQLELKLKKENYIKD